ncbi:hypothetical protein [Actinoplanes lobatus]|uniref:Uncharacterized protein n=1 Tax=Actinoplanes lobatus TaxID=113568 RepID=A0A7W7MLW5_9ACTN|nr:hypothetical protein [Actinoplanes lobatus]MBB4755297.1 hypothetical protein [Actinoplanes lobatus]GIE46207.1 hypothetical protein Alo02nite_91050 [Actinoplanes lobatus]
MIREQLESDESDLGFEYFLAEKLRMTVARMRREMSEQEFATWAIWYGIKAQRRELAMGQAGG